MPRGKHKVLVIDEWVPFPLNIGKKIRTFNLLKNLAKKYSIDIICFADLSKETESITYLNSLGITVIPIEDKRIRHGSLRFFLDLFLNHFSNLPFSVAYHYRRPFFSRMIRELNRTNYDLIHFEWTQMSKYLCNFNSNIPVVISAHNVEAMLLYSLYRSAPSILRKFVNYLQMKKMTRFEKWAYNKADYVTAVSEKDAAIISDDYGQKNVVVISNGVDLDYFRNKNPETQNNTLLFFGAMDYYPNIQAVCYFVEEIAPILIRKLPNFNFSVVGRNPDKKLFDLAQKLHYFSITGTVEDIRPYYKKAAIFVVPLKAGGGTRLKIIEAMAMEMPVISTTIGAESLQYEDGVNIIIANTPKQFSDEIIRLTKNPQLRMKMGKVARRLVEKYYGWEQITAVQDQLWNQLINHEKNRKANGIDYY